MPRGTGGVPELETERLLLRPLAEGDLQAHAAFGADERVISLVHRDNAASIRVAEKLAMRVERRVDIRGTPTLVYARRRVP